MTRAKDRIILANGDVMTLGEALDAGRVVIREGTNKRGGKCWTAWEDTAGQGWAVRESLFRSRAKLPFKVSP